MNRTNFREVTVPRLIQIKCS